MEKEWLNEWEDIEDKTKNEKILTEEEKQENAVLKTFEKFMKNGEIELATQLFNKEEEN
ncbi:MAG: hypothetical protein PHU94_02870 [Bacilli bacterium]|nr:hypothetical protein [Bacilli bacterium]MDD4733583.1 hypothetical protein [Bacilli bacterium]